MPMITVRYVTPQPRPELRGEVAALAARLGQECLGKDPGVTAVLVEPADPEGWFIAGRRPALVRRDRDRLRPRFARPRPGPPRRRRWGRDGRVSDLIDAERLPQRCTPESPPTVGATGSSSPGTTVPPS